MRWTALLLLAALAGAQASGIGDGSIGELGAGRGAGNMGPT